MGSVADLVVASATVKAGKLYIRHRRQFDLQIAQMKDGWELEVAVQRRRATRSVTANAYYWGVVLFYVSEHTGDSPEDLHEYFKKRFNPKPLAIAREGEDQVIGGTTRTMNTVQFYAYVEQIRQFAAEFLDCNIPSPGEGAA